MQLENTYKNSGSLDEFKGRTKEEFLLNENNDFESNEMILKNFFEICKIPIKVKSII